MVFAFSPRKAESAFKNSPRLIIFSIILPFF